MGKDQNPKSQALLISGFYHFQPAIPFVQLFEHAFRTRLVLAVSGMDNHDKNQAQRIDGQVSLSAVDLFPRVIATFCSSFGCANRLAVNDGCRGRRFLPMMLSYFLSQTIMNPLPSAIISPVPEYPVNCAPIWQVFWKHSPLASRSCHIQYGVDNPSSIDRPSTSTRPRRQQLPDQLPLSICQIAGILRPAFHGYGSFR